MEPIEDYCRYILSFDKGQDISQISKRFPTKETVLQKLEKELNYKRTTRFDCELAYALYNHYDTLLSHTFDLGSEAQNVYNNCYKRFRQYRDAALDRNPIHDYCSNFNLLCDYIWLIASLHYSDTNDCMGAVKLCRNHKDFIVSMSDYLEGMWRHIETIVNEADLIERSLNLKHKVLVRLNDDDEAVDYDQRYSREERSNALDEYRQWIPEYTYCYFILLATTVRYDEYMREL